MEDGSSNQVRLCPLSIGFVSLPWAGAARRDVISSTS